MTSKSPHDVGFDDSDALATTWLCACDQNPFNAQGNRFCVLHPLMSLDGQIADAELFPNRGRLWWMVKNWDLDSISPGVLVTARIEPALDYSVDRAEKDAFQARKDSVTLGWRNHVEILETEEDLDIDVLLAAGLGWPRLPAQRVLVAGPKWIVGPFQTSWDRMEKLVRLEAMTPGNPAVWRAPIEALPPDSIHRLEFTANVYDPQHNVTEIRINVGSEALLQQLGSVGEELDAADDTQVINWGLKLIPTSKRADGRRLKELRELAEQVPLPENAPADRLERFKRICRSAERVQSIGAEAAETLCEAQPAFEEFLQKHADQLTRARVDERVRTKTEEVNRRIKDENERLERVRAEAASLAEDLERKRVNQITTLEREHADWITSLEERERELAEKEANLEARELETTAGLEQAIASYEGAADRVAERILTDYPILQRLGVTGGGDRGPKALEGRSTTLTLPDWLDSPRKSGDLDEPGFIEQFEHVVDRRGFVFSRDDLVNFHVSVKTGLWTVLAGASGTGKSSLPRLYADALGVSDELLWVDVRPDWLDDRDVLGGLNALTQRYEPAAAGVVDHLIAAHEDLRRERGGIYLIALDEMNLARVEHYFAQFLSVMERPPSARSVRLFSRGAARPDDPYLPYQRLPVGQNVRFIGTVNVDETTHFFSPKVIDRTSILTLDEPDVERSGALAGYEGPIPGLAPVTWADYTGWVRPSHIDLSLDVLDEVNSVLREHRSGLAHRAMRRIRTYVASADGLISRERAVDLAIGQIVLWRLSSTAPSFTRMLERLAQVLPESRYPQCGRLLERLAESDGLHDLFQLL